MISLENNNFLLFAIGLLAACVILYFIVPDSGASSSQPETPRIQFSYSVKGCAETTAGMTAKGMGQPERGPSIMVSGGTITYSRALNHQCCRKATVEKEIGSREISIFDTWGGPGCKCMCFSEVAAKLENVLRGHYTITVYERGTKPQSSEEMQQTVVTTQEIAVR
jgi:hypothetical protein